MISIEPFPLHTSSTLLARADAEVIAQKINLTSLKKDDRLLGCEEILLRFMVNNAAAARLLVSIGQDQ